MARILVVDDDGDILETLRFAFEQEGHAVQVEADGLAALQRARQQPPDLALLDVMLPGLNGYEVSRRLKAEMRRGALPRFPILMLTARRVAAGERQQFLASWSQADLTLWKPYDLGFLLFQVREALAATSGAVS
ncbi:MAG TPA: response regulator [Candidatus Krumholzibacteria bacterium]|jgi:two-component system, OmpR family, response regulator|nr:response regulator [Candidatus Krumholzibacteria bacterium]